MMLLEFSVENFLSFKERVSFSMLASNDHSLDKNLIQSPKKNEHLLRSAVVYGANASGKTNLMKAIQFMKYMVIDNATRKKGESTEVIPFKLDKNFESKPSSFEVRFYQDSIKYIYGFSLTRDKITEEYLYFFPKGSKSLIFERTEQNFHFTKDIDIQEPLAKRTIENRLYMPNATDWNYDKTEPAYRWFQENLNIVLFSNPLISAVEKFTNEKMREGIQEYIIKADLGIVGVEASIKNVDEVDLPSTFPDALKSFLVGSKSTDIKTTHLGLDENGNQTTVQFDLETDESRGTLKMFELAAQWSTVLSAGSILVYDELDTSLHPLLVEYLVGLFHEPSRNKNNAQLIFTTHNTNLLNSKLFRRDQVWFVNKIDGESILYSLLEMKVRKGENYENGYLKGRYQGVPILDY